MSKKLELISFKLCPFVQRAIIVLRKKEIEFDITYIDLEAPPKWFKEISPLGQVPVLRVGDDILFESSVIQEYVDEITPPSLQPKNVLTKAKNRAWISFGGDVFMLQYMMGVAKDKAIFDEKTQQLTQKLALLEQQHSASSFFNGTEFTMIDAAFAPFFMRNELLKNYTKVDLLDGLPNLQKWSQNLLALDCVHDSVVPDFADLYQAYIVNADGYIASLFEAA